MQKTYNLFISHSWAYSDAYEKLTSLLNNYSYFDYKNYSVPKDDPIHTKGADWELAQAIESKVKSCSVVLILAGVYSTHSKWIKKEITIAQKLGKSIIAIQPWASEKTSQTVKDSADEIVGWNSSSVVNAIREHSP